MSVIEMPLRARRPSLARSEPASVSKHPAVPHDFAADAIAKMRADAEKREAEQEADQQMAYIHRELEMVTLKAEHVAKLHDRAGQAVLMFEVAKARIKAALFPQ
jgi:hypothetical protein